MLAHLQIRDLAVIDAAEFELGAGLSALTGETGAGKSIIVDAVMLALGARASADALRHGVPKELARVHLPVGRYSRMRASAVLLNWLRFLALRMAPDAQWEIRQFANAVGGLIAEKFPRTWELFAEGLRR